MTNYTNPVDVTGVRITAQPNYGRTVSGYGSKIPTRWMIRYRGVWRRVYIVQYGNAGSAYVLVKGEMAFVDTDTEHRMMSQQ